MDITELAQRLGDELALRGAQVTTAESCTGGGIAEAITRIAGSSAWFEAGYITYSNAQKTSQLNVPAALFTSVGAVSGPVATIVMPSVGSMSIRSRTISTLGCSASARVTPSEKTWRSTASADPAGTLAGSACAMISEPSRRIS